MAAKITNPWNDGRNCDVSDDQCCARPCLHVAEHKGTFQQGRGYTSYFKYPQLVCWTRHLHGCPNPKPEINPETVRCCRVPRFPASKIAKKQRCLTCGQWATGWVLATRKALPTLEHVDCKHTDVNTTQDELFRGTLHRCRKCSAYWLRGSPPQPCEPGKTYAQLLDERFPIR